MTTIYLFSCLIAGSIGPRAAKVASFSMSTKLPSKSAPLSALTEEEDDDVVDRGSNPATVSSSALPVASNRSRGVSFEDDDAVTAVAVAAASATVPSCNVQHMGMSSKNMSVRIGIEKLVIHQELQVAPPTTIDEKNAFEEEDAEEDDDDDDMATDVDNKLSSTGSSAKHGTSSKHNSGTPKTSTPTSTRESSPRSSLRTATVKSSSADGKKRVSAPPGKPKNHNEHQSPRNKFNKQKSSSPRGASPNKHVMVDNSIEATQRRMEQQIEVFRVLCQSFCSFFFNLHIFYIYSDVYN